MNAHTTVSPVRFYSTAAVAVFFLVSAVAFSATHITDGAHRLGLTGVSAAFAYLYVDGMIVLGKLCQGIPGMHRVGTVLMVSGGTLSLAANVLVGHNAGERLFGFVIVAICVVCEVALEKMAAARRIMKVEQAAITAAAALTAKRSDSARRAAVTRRSTAAAPVRKSTAGRKHPADCPCKVHPRNRLALTESTKDLVREVAQLIEDPASLPNAPVSPAVIATR